MATQRHFYQRHSEVTDVVGYSPAMWSSMINGSSGWKIDRTLGLHRSRNITARGSGTL